MKFLLYLFCILIFFPSSCSAIEEVILNIDDNNAPEPKAEKIFDEDDKFTLYEKIRISRLKRLKIQTVLHIF